MITEESLCVGCPPYICNGGCEYAHPIKFRVCDRCEWYEDKLYLYNSEQLEFTEELCLDCVTKAIIDDTDDEQCTDEYIDNIINGLTTIDADDVPQSD